MTTLTSVEAAQQLSLAAQAFARTVRLVRSENKHQEVLVALEAATRALSERQVAECIAGPENPELATQLQGAFEDLARTLHLVGSEHAPQPVRTES